MSTTASPPVAKKVIAAFLAGVVATVIQAVVPGYQPEVWAASLITTVIATASAFAYREELKYLLPATKTARK